MNSRLFSALLTLFVPDMLACEAQTYFRSSLLSPLHDALEQPKTNFDTNFRFKRVLGFVIEDA